MSMRSLPGSSSASYQVSTLPSGRVVFCVKVRVRYHLPAYRSRIRATSSSPFFGGGVAAADAAKGRLRLNSDNKSRDMTPPEGYDGMKLRADRTRWCNGGFP